MIKFRSVPTHRSAQFPRSFLAAKVTGPSVAIHDRYGIDGFSFGAIRRASLAAREADRSRRIISKPQAREQHRPLSCDFRIRLVIG